MRYCPNRPTEQAVTDSDVQLNHEDAIASFILQTDIGAGALLYSQNLLSNKLTHIYLGTTPLLAALAPDDPSNLGPTRLDRGQSNDAEDEVTEITSDDDLEGTFNVNFLTVLLTG